MDHPPKPSGSAAAAPSMSIVELITAGTIDAELAALVWLLLDGGVPLLVAALPRGSGKSTVLEALLAFLPPDVGRRELRGASEDLSFLASADPRRTYLVVAELSDHRPAYTWGDGARSAVRAIQDGFGLAATLPADSLEEVFERLEAPPVSLTTDEIRRMGVVLVVRALPPSRVTAAVRRRVVAAHYLRPLERDMHGHLQRRPPAVLATWEPESDTFEHFAWGVMPELAARVGQTQADVERSLDRRRRFLEGLAAAGRSSSDELTDALADFRGVEAGHATPVAAADHGHHHPH